MSDLLEPPGREDVTPTPTYYDRPLLKMPHWDDWNVITYLFLGGVMGGLGVIGALASNKRKGERKLKRTLAVTSLVLSVACPSCAGHAPRAAGALLAHATHHEVQIADVARRLGPWCFIRTAPVRTRCASSPGSSAVMQALFGAFLMGYTGVLISATANPLWSSGKRHIPAAFVCSSMSAACALSSLLSTLEGNSDVVHKLEQLEMLAAAGELAVLMHFEQNSGDYGKALFASAHGERLRKYTVRTGILAPLALNLLGAARSASQTGQRRFAPSFRRCSRW